MPPTPRLAFPHRRNPDGTFDSICSQCLATVARKPTEPELQAPERAHRCHGFNLESIIYRTDQRLSQRFK